MKSDIRYSQQDAAETGHGWYAVRRDRAHKLPDVSHLIRKSSTPVADCPMPEYEFRPVIYVPQPRLIPGIAANQIQPPPAAPGGRVAA